MDSQQHNRVRLYRLSTKSQEKEYICVSIVTKKRLFFRKKRYSLFRGDGVVIQK
jgi:hypothetical protein